MLTESPYTNGEIIYTDSEYFYLIRTDNDVVFESWHTSTKHPDVTYRYSNWKNKSVIIDDDFQIYQWLLFIASDTLFPFRAKEIARFAENVYHIFNE